MQRFKIDMFPSTDTDGKIIYVGRVLCPISIDLSKGVAFLFYPDNPEQAEIHICPLDSPDLSDVFEHYKTRRERILRSKLGHIPIELHARLEKPSLKNPSEHRRKFYIGRLLVNGNINCSQGVVFLAFISDEGEEELQIGAIDHRKMEKRSTPTPMPGAYRRAFPDGRDK